jgi:putative SOS response-associated peptidase YedK
MCGRYARRGSKQKIAEWFHVKGDLGELPMPDADYNIAPSTSQPIIRQSRETGERELILARWGLVPFFTKDPKDIKGLSTINARADKVVTSPTWREPMKKRRCLIPASSFYEWPQAGKPPKQPYSFELANGNMFAFAGLWDAWKDADGHWLQSFAMVTTEANELMARIHSRIPVMLHERDYDRWLNRGETERLPLDLLRPFEAEEMEMHEANPKVNNVRNNGPDMLIKPDAGSFDRDTSLEGLQGQGICSG